MIDIFLENCLKTTILFFSAIISETIYHPASHFGIGSPFFCPSSLIGSDGGWSQRRTGSEEGGDRHRDGQWHGRSQVGLGDDPSRR